MSSRPRSPRPLRPGRRLAPGYTVLEHLARGEALDVYDAWDAERHCRCVVKLPRPDRAEDPGTCASLRREGRLLTRLAHPHLVRAYALLPGPPPALVLETLGGETLADNKQVLALHRRFGFKETRRYERLVDGEPKTVVWTERGK